MRLRLFASGAFLLLFIGQCQSQFRPPQVDITDADTVGYDFVQQEANVIDHAEALEPFLQKLYLQRIYGGQQVRIVHLGDSHVQGNFLTHQVRKRLQHVFGDAGRGLVFPYKLAKTNGPQDYLVETNCNGSWRAANCQRDLDEATPFGVSGFTLETTGPNCELTFRLRDTATAEVEPFTQVTIFHRKSPAAFDLRVYDDVTGQQGKLFLAGEYSSSFYFERPVGQFTLAAQRTVDGQRSLTLDGISLENELSGVVYHSIGVNGAKFVDFARARYFAKEVAELQPDLIILSFGTNEAQGKNGPPALYNQMKELVNQLQAEVPNASFLLTTPADSYLRSGRSFNPYMTEACAVIRNFARERGLALWDMYTLTGGAESARNWKNSGLMTSDSVHYTRWGYAVQGKLLYQSLIRTYNEFVDGK